ncbi:MAG: dienelactone hydrolase family protein [Caulobacterales bacterium]
MLLTRPDGPHTANLEKLTRRGFGTALFVAGYAAAIRPVNAAAITTDDKGLIIEEVKIKSFGDFNLPAYVARPAGNKKKRAAIVVVNEVFGIHDYIKDVCRRFAKLGYVAIAPDYFDRAGDPATLTMEQIKDVLAIVGTAKYAQVMGDTSAAGAYLKSLPYVNGDKLGITGFCWGGGVVWSACEASPLFKAGVAWYGKLSKPGPDSPLPAEDRPYPVDAVSHLYAPVLGLYAENDQGIPLAEVEAMRKALSDPKSSASAKKSKIEVFPGAEHGFHADYRPSYNEAAAKSGWSQALAWFKANGVV